MNRFAAGTIAGLVGCAAQAHTVHLDDHNVDTSACEPDGAELFTHEWTVDDPLSMNGDGLGPLYNARSCESCHNQGGVGGGGGAERNVTLRNGAVLHSQGTSAAYAAFRQRRMNEPDPVEAKVEPPKLKAGSRAEAAAISSLISALSSSGVHSGLGSHGSGGSGGFGRLLVAFPTLTERNTPALFGTGLLDTVTEEQIIAGLCTADARFPEITGRITRHGDSGEIGRFGWKGDVPTLAAFVEGACANELGLEVMAAQQAPDPTDDAGESQGLDMDPGQVFALTNFVGDLPAPRRATGQPRSGHGERLFESIGCASCHQPTIGHVEGAYTDLLVHDMGRGLDDGVPTLATYGGTQLQAKAEGTGDQPAGTREWRTPALWGVADSAPYLHDGRAPTLLDAIGLHGGEASSTLRRFQTLSPSEQEAIIAFLRTLRAPRAETLAMN